MGEEKIVITFPKEGGVKIEVRGVVGQGCLEWTKPLEDAFGGASEERELKTEFYETEQEGQKLLTGK